MLPLLEAVAQSGRPLLISRKTSKATHWRPLWSTSLRGGLKVAAVKAPGFGDRRKAMLEDIAVLTGGQVDFGRSRHQARKRHARHARHAPRRSTITKDETTIVDGAGKKADIQGRCNQIRAQIEETSSDYDREKLQERLAKLAGGVAIIRVGGATEIEVKEKQAIVSKMR